MKTKFQVGERVAILSGVYCGRVGICEGMRKGKVLVRLAPSATNTSQPTIGFAETMIQRIGATA